MSDSSIREVYSDLLEHIDNVAADIRGELDDHLQSINDNTEEISIQNSAICEIDNRLNKLEEKLDKVHFMFKQLLNRSLVSVDLSKDEQKSFLTLYTHDGFLSVPAISKRTGMEHDSVEESLMSLMDKGVPVEREIIDMQIYFRLNKEFRLRQAKEQLITVDPEIKQQFQNALLKEFFSS